MFYERAVPDRAGARPFSTYVHLAYSGNARHRKTSLLITVDE